MPQTATKQLRLPIHDHADQHKVLRALKRYKTPQRLELAMEKRPCAEIAAERIKEFLWDLGAEKDWYRWIAAASRAAGLNYRTAYDIATGRKNYVGPRVVDQIATITGIPVSVFYDEEI